MLFALEIGRTNVRAVAGIAAKGAMEIVGVGSAPVWGLGPDGEVLHTDAVVDSIRAAVSEAEEGAGIRASCVELGLPASLMTTHELVGRVGLRSALATPIDLERASRDALAQAPGDCEHLHVRLKEMVVGEDPLGRSDTDLTATFLVLSLPRRAMDRHRHCANLAGLEVSGVVPASVAAAEATLTPGLKQQGIFLAHLEGGVADTVVYRGGMLRSARSVRTLELAQEFENAGGLAQLPAGIVLTGEAAPAADLAAEPWVSDVPLRRDGAWTTVRADLAAGVGLLYRGLERARTRRERALA